MRNRYAVMIYRVDDLDFDDNDEDWRPEPEDEDRLEQVGSATVEASDPRFAAAMASLEDDDRRGAVGHRNGLDGQVGQVDVEQSGGRLVVEPRSHAGDERVVPLGPLPGGDLASPADIGAARRVDHARALERQVEGDRWHRRAAIGRGGD